MTLDLLPDQINPEEARRAVRRKGIGGSDAAAILGIPTFKTMARIWAEKLNLVPHEAESEVMRLGKVLEPLIAAKYSELTGKRVTKPREECARHPLLPYILGSLDRVHVEDGTPVEIKTAPYPFKEWGPAGSDVVPDDYLCQCQHYLLISQKPTINCIVLFRGPAEYRVYQIRADRDLHDLMVKRYQWFWETFILGGKQPPMDGTEECRSYLAARYPAHREGKTISADQDLERLALELREARDNYSHAEEVKLRTENEIKARMEDAEVVLGADWRISWKATAPRSGVDWEALARSMDPNPDQLAAFTVTKPGYRVFRPSFKGEREKPNE